MDTSFTEHVLERARERQKKLLPLREANFGTTESKSQPNLRSTPNIIKAVRKDVVSDPIICTSTPDKNNKMTKQSSKTSISSMVTGSIQGQINTLNIERDNLNMEIKISSCDNVRVEVEIDTDGENNENNYGQNENINYGQNENINYGQNENVNYSTPGPDVVDCENNENVEGPALREHAKHRLQRLGQLYSGSDDLSSPIHRTEANFLIDDDDKEPRIENEKKMEVIKGRKGLGKLADLANNINQWEDEVTPIRKDVIEKKTPVKKSWKPPAPQPPGSQTNSPVKHTTKTKAPAPKPPSSPEKSTVTKGINKQIKWDPSVIECLEVKKPKQKPTKIEKIQEEKEPESNVSKSSIKTKSFAPLNSHKEEEKVTPRSPVKNRGNAIAGRAAMFEQGQTTSPAKKEKDPALLSVSERKALFEKNRGEALVPKAAFGMAAPIKTAPKQQPSSSHSIADKIAELNNKSKTISQDQIERKVTKERQEEMDVVLNRFNQNKQITLTQIDSDSESEDEHTVSETTAMIATKSVKIVSPREVLGTPPPPPPASSESRKSGEKRTKKGDSPQVQAVLGEIKRIKVTQPKDGKLYPCLSDIEAATETETERTVSPSPQNSLLETSFCGSDDANTSFGRDILRAVCIDKTNQQTENQSDSSESSISDVLEDMNDYLDELDQDTDISGPTPPKQGKLVSPQKALLTQPSESFNYKNYSPRKQNSPSRFKSPVKIITSPKRRDTGDLPTHVVDGKDVMPLTYTVSFYRKQQTQASTTPIRQIARPTCVDEEEEEFELDTVEIDAVTAKIDQLLEEINKQQMVISQTSRALNLCNATPEFTGSTEQVEAEKVLLLATHRRQAATVEIQRLKVEQSLRPLGSNQNMPLEKGTLTISNITLPLKKEYVRALAAAGGKGHHVVCLLKSGEQVVMTQLVSTVASSSKNPDLELKIPGQVKLENIYSDFAVTFEVYCLQAQEEFLPHEVKYHIGKKASSKLTPKKSKQDSRMMRPPKESPAGPQAVRTSSFALNGYVIFSIQAINKTNWTLNKTPPISPLEGCVTMKVNCVIDISVELRGFLNMFEDISGLGAWHRRWCLLKGHTISYWRYPEDERKKAPIDTIDLKSCITKKVGPVSRDICARLNTFLVERERPAQPHDKDTLTVVCESNKTIIKHLLSADSKEERTEWCDNLNKALNAIRIWGTKTDV